MSRNVNRFEKGSCEVFICRHCGRTVIPLQSGGNQRNHCPDCLWSLHVDLRTGDRMSGCRGLMEPIAVWVKPSQEWAVLHRCQSCGFIRANRIAGDDDELVLLKMAARPLTMLPFPAEKTWEKIS